jgi:hypothetical protein
VRSSQPDVVSPVSVVRVESEVHIRSAVARRLDEIAQSVGNGGKQKVLLLGRYQKDRDYLPGKIGANIEPNLNLNLI